MRRTLQGKIRGRSGLAGAWVIVSFMALAGMAALVIDLGQLVIAAQRCQDVADAAALAGAPYLPYSNTAKAAALATAVANNTDGTGWEVECTSADITFYAPGETIGTTVLGPWAHGLEVTARAPVEYTFSRILGISGAVAQRRARIFRGPVEGVPICTMWIAHETPLAYGQLQNLLMADGPHYAGIPGSFGFLESPPGCTASWDKLLQGYGLTYQDIETSFVNLGDSVWAKTGVAVGHWRKALVDDKGTSRYEVGTSGKFAGDTFENYHADNPRIMLLPLVSYLGGTGSNAEFKIEKFGAFWLEGVNQGQKQIIGRFIQFDLPGGSPNSQLQSETGVFATQLMP